jgi:hypothetical protein
VHDLTLLQYRIKEKSKKGLLDWINGLPWRDGYARVFFVYMVFQFYFLLYIVCICWLSFLI